jgi:serine/threonine protein kinase
MSSQESRLALPQGYQLHAYRIEGTLGRGGFGVTYEGVEEHTGRRVAIKEYLPAFIAVRSGDGTSVLPAESAAEPDYHWGLDRFRSEARTLLDVRHPNIVPVLQYFEANSTGYLVMEYQEGEALDVILAPDKVLDPDELDELFLPLLDGLAVVHAAGYLHRDIKPANIFVRRDGRPVLLDFGAARMALSGHSKSLTTIISEGYAPYEQYESDSPQGPWTDIYGFGATMYRCMTGLKPADAPSRVAAEMRSATDPLKPIAEAAKKRYQPRQIEAAARALRVVEEQRPQSVTEMQGLLMPTRAAAGRAAATSDEATDAPVSSRKANMLAVVGGAAATMIGIVVIVLALVFSGSGNGPDTATPADPSDPVVRQQKASFLRACLTQTPSQRVCQCRADYLYSRLTKSDIQVFAAYQRAGRRGDMRTFVKQHFKGDAAKVKAFMTRLTGTMMGALGNCKK